MRRTKKIVPEAELMGAFDEIERTRGIGKGVLMEALSEALVSGYKKNFNSNRNVEVDINPETFEVHVYSVKDVVEELENPVTQISLTEAQKLSPLLEVGDVVKEEVTPRNFGRVAAQTTKQVIMQKIRDAQRDVLFDEYVVRENELITGTVSRVNRGTVYVDLGKVEGVLSPTEQIPSEKYRQGDRLKFLLLEVKRTTKEPQIILSRSHPHLVAKLFELEVPEIQSGVMEIFSVSREAGSRTKIAVYSKNSDVDALGSSVGYKGSRVRAIVESLGDEKIDIILYDKDINVFVANSLSPAKVLAVFSDYKEHSSVAIVPENQLSLAIGKEGQNVRLAAKLVNWKIDIKSKTQFEEEKGMTIEEMAADIDNSQFGFMICKEGEEENFKSDFKMGDDTFYA